MQEEGVLYIVVMRVVSFCARIVMGETNVQTKM